MHNYTQNRQILQEYVYDVKNQDGSIRKQCIRKPET